MQRIIWSSIIKLEDWEDYLSELEEEREEKLTEEEKWNIVTDNNMYFYNYERDNLDIDLNENIVILASLGLWHGRVNGVKEIGDNIKDCLYTDCDNATWYCDGYNFCCTAYHHDGTNHYTYRVYKDGLTEEQKEYFKQKYMKGEANSNFISRYTKSLRPFIKQVYGW